MRNYQGNGYSIKGIHRINKYLNGAELECIARRVEGSDASEVWICMPISMGNEIQDLMMSLRYLTVEVRFFPELKDLPLLNHRVSEVIGLYSIDLSVTPISGGSRILKRLEDILLGGLIFLLIFPICLVLAFLIKFSSPGPVLFKQYRMGINGKRFKVYKFRTMNIHCEDGGGFYIRQLPMA